jgi:6-phosphogluconate dehydrogenase (decarboxylating)
MQSFGKLGWIGLGNMGSRIAKRLRNAGYPLIVYNRDRSKSEDLISQGADIAASPAELAARPTSFSRVSAMRPRFKAFTSEPMESCAMQNPVLISSR